MCFSEFLGSHRNFQDEESEAGGGGLWPDLNTRSSLLPGPDAKEIHSTLSGNSQVDHVAGN